MSTKVSMFITFIVSLDIMMLILIFMIIQYHPHAIHTWTDCLMKSTTPSKCNSEKSHFFLLCFHISAEQDRSRKQKITVALVSGNNI